MDSFWYSGTVLASILFDDERDRHASLQVILLGVAVLVPLSALLFAVWYRRRESLPVRDSNVDAVDSPSCA
jgi:hypothetical protein